MQYRTARSMVFEAYRSTGDSSLAGAIEKARLKADIQTTRRQNNDASIAHGLEAGMVISRVESLPEHLQALVRYCFGPFTPRELLGDRERVQRALIAKLMSDGRRLPGQGRDEEGDAVALRQMHALCAAAVYHHGEVTWPYSRPGLPTPQAVKAWLADKRGMTLEHRWRREGRVSWHDIWEHCLRVLDDWEGRGLEPVAALLEEDREARRETSLG